MKIKHELQSKKNKALGEVGYGCMGLFLGILVEGISYTKGFEGLFYHFVAIAAGIASIYKFIIGFRKLRKIK